jgi:hypothetical protein
MMMTWIDLGLLCLFPVLFLISKALDKKEWVDLTDDEMLMIYGQNHEGKKYNLGRMVQQALKEKNT